MATQHGGNNRVLLVVFSFLLISCGTKKSTPQHENLEGENSNELLTLLDNQFKVESQSLVRNRGIVNYDANFCPAIIVFGDSPGKPGSSCVNWDLNIKSAFEPGPLVLPTSGSSIDLLRSVLLEANDQIQSTSQWAIHANTSTSTHMDGLIFNAQAGSNVRIRGTVKSCDGRSTETISQDIAMSTGNRGRVPVFGNNQNIRFLVHPNSKFCQSTQITPTSTGTRLEFSRTTSNYVEYVKVQGGGNIVRGCSGPNVFCSDQIADVLSLSQQQRIESLIFQARSGTISSSSFHCDPGVGTSTSAIKYTADNQSVALTSYTDPCRSFEQLNGSPAAAELIRFLDQYRN